MNDNSKTVVALIAGLAAGAALGILFAPDKGGETQDRLSRALSDLKDKIIDSTKEAIEKLTTTGEEVSEKINDRFFGIQEEAKESVAEKIAEN